MEFKDYYKALGVERSASDDDIKKAFRRLARKHHPDLSKAADAPARMQEINEAYEVLRDPQRRAAYDQVGQGRRGGERFEPPPDWGSGFEFSGGPGDGFDAERYSEFFETLFGSAVRGGARGRGAARGFESPGQDHHARVMITLEDAFVGATRHITLQSPELDAHGQVHLRQRELQVTIPKGVRAGQQIRLAGQGAPGIAGGPPGDLYLEVHYEPHPRYRVDGRDLYVTLPVAPWEAALGATVEVPTPAGTLEVTVPAGSQAGRRLRLKGRGLPGAEPGDLYAVLQVVLPPASSEKAQALYRQMAREMAFDARAPQGGER
jgi:curved DNA-binding protein